MVDVTSGAASEIRERREVRVLGRRAVAGVPAAGARAEEGRRTPRRRPPPASAKPGGAAAKKPPAPQAAQPRSRGRAGVGRRRRSRSTLPRSSSPVTVSTGRQGQRRVREALRSRSAPSPAAGRPKGRYESLAWSKDGAGSPSCGGREGEGQARARPRSGLGRRDAAGERWRAGTGAEGLDAALEERPGVVEGRQAAVLRVQAAAGRAPMRRAAKTRRRTLRPIRTTSTRSSRRSKVTCGTGTTRASSRSRRCCGSARRTGRIAPCCTWTAARSSRWPASTCPTSRSPRTRALALATSDLPYQKQTTWGEGARDVFVVDLADGRADAVASGCAASRRCRPTAGSWPTSTTGSGSCSTRRRRRPAWPRRRSASRSPTRSTTRPTRRRPTASAGGWTRAPALLVYDRYDIWQVPTAGGAPVNLTGKAGRAAQITFRVVTLDPETARARAAASRCC